MSKEVGGMPKYGVPGNAAEESRLHGEFVRRVGIGWLETARVMGGLASEGVRVHRVSVKGAWSDQGDFLVILAAETQEGPVVAFHGCEDVTTMWSSLARRIEKGKLKWKDDEYA